MATPQKVSKEAGTKMQIVIRSFDEKFLEQCLPPHTKRIKLPDSRVLYTVLRSPHIDKKSREQFQMKIKKQLLVIQASAEELRSKYFWLKRQRIFGAQFEIKIFCKTRLGCLPWTLLSSADAMNKKDGDQASHIDSMAKHQGIVAAEDYFAGLPETWKKTLTHEALLNAYCKELMTQKAEGLVEEMKELNLGLSSVSYKSLMHLYKKTGESEKIPPLIEQMKANGVILDLFTYNVWMKALAAVGDIAGVENVVEEIKKDRKVGIDWTVYTNLASIYIGAGLPEKADQALKELEKKNKNRDLSALQFLITSYGRLGNLTQVHRVWDSLRKAFPQTPNISYLNTAQVLVNLKDLAGAEKCFSEWESNCSTYDVRILNLLLKAYVDQGLLEKAEEMKERAISGGAKLNSKTWEIFLEHHLKNKNIESITNCIGEATSAGDRDHEKWVPSSGIITSLMVHFEQEKDVDGAHSVFEYLNKVKDRVGVQVFESLIRTYAAAGRSSHDISYWLKLQNVQVSEASQKLLQSIMSK